MKARLLEDGETVLEPFGDNERYDLAVDKGGGEIERIQVKTARSIQSGKAIMFNCESVYLDSEGVKRRDYEKSEIDCFMAYHPKSDKIYKVNVEEAPSTVMKLRKKSKIDDPKINWISDYEY